MPIEFIFRNIVDKRGVGAEVLHSNELYLVSASGMFKLSLQPLTSPVMTVWHYAGGVPTFLTKTSTLSAVTSGSKKFYVDFSTRNVIVDPALIGFPVYATYSSAYTHVVNEVYTLSAPEADGLCRMNLQEAPLVFALTSSDSRKIYITATLSGSTQILQETKTLADVYTTSTNYYVEFDLGRIAFNPALVGYYINATYHGYGSIMWAEDVKELQAAITMMDHNVVDRNGSNAMTGDLLMNDFSSIVGLGTGKVDTIKLATHNHQGGAGQGVVLSAADAVISNTVLSAQLNSKAISGSGAVAA